MNGIPKTNAGVVTYGKRADEEDFIPGGTHMVIRDSWSWIDLLAMDGTMLRLRGPAHCVLTAAAWRDPAAINAAKTSANDAARQERAEQTSSSARAFSGSQTSAPAADGEDAEPENEPAAHLRRLLRELWEHEDMPGDALSDTPAPPSPQTEAAEVGRAMIEPVLSVLSDFPDNHADSESGGRPGQLGFTLHYGIMIAKPGKDSVADVQNDNFSCTNISVPFLVDADMKKRVRVIILNNQTLAAWARIPSLNSITMRNDEEKKAFASDTISAFRYTVPERIPVYLRRDQVNASDAILYQHITNAMTNRRIELEAIAESNAAMQLEESPKMITNRILVQTPRRDMIENFLMTLTNAAATNDPGQPFTLAIPPADKVIPPELRPDIYWEGDMRTFVLGQLAGKSFWGREAFPRRQTDYFDLISETEALDIRYGPVRRRPASR